MFFNKKEKNKNVSLENIASLLIHAAKIDENYSSKEEEIIKKSLIDLGANEKNLDSLQFKKKMLVCSLYYKILKCIVSSRL